MKISIIIPHRNTSELLRSCLTAVRDFTPQSHEIIVVDDGSTYDIWPLPSPNEHGNLTVKKLDGAHGFTYAVNRGLEMRGERGEHVVLLNSDVLVSDGWLTALLDALKIDPRIGIVSAQVRDAWDRNFIRAGGATAPGIHRHGWADKGELQELRIDGDCYLPFTCVLLNGKMVKELGLLDEQFRIFSSDNDYCHRAQLAGWKLCYQPASVVYHEDGATIRTLLDNMEFCQWVQGDNDRYTAKWPEVKLQGKEIKALQETPLKDIKLSSKVNALIEKYQRPHIMTREAITSIAKWLQVALQHEGDWLVEIGAFLGDTTAFMGQVLRLLSTKKHRILSIDAFELADINDGGVGNQEAYWKSVKSNNLEGMVICIAKRSHDAISEVSAGFNFIVIDGSHKYENVKTDIQDYLPKLKPGGFVWFHDYNMHPATVGCFRAINEFIALHTDWDIMEKGQGFIVLQKPKEAEASPC